MCIVLIAVIASNESRWFPLVASHQDATRGASSAKNRESFSIVI